MKNSIMNCEGTMGLQVVLENWLVMICKKKFILSVASLGKTNSKRINNKAQEIKYETLQKEPW